MPSTRNIYIYMNKMPSDIWAQNNFKVSDLLAEQKKWIQGLEKLQAKI